MTPRVLIIGAGFSGICIGIALKRRGIESFTIVEKADRVGGTWRDNTYPGCSCDSPAFHYCFSFEQKTDWSHKWVSHTEIQRYMEHCVQKYDLTAHIRFGTEVKDAAYDADRCQWLVTTVQGEHLVCDALICAVGQLHRPHIPAIRGIEAFAGAQFHSARWAHDVELSGKRVAVVGNAASAVQFIPVIAPLVDRLAICQRSPNWMLPRGDRPFSTAEHDRFARYPLWARVYRWWQWLRHELRFPIVRGAPWLSRLLARAAERHMRSIVVDPDLQGRLVPSYPIGGKGILISDDYYQTLNRPNVELIDEPIARITRDGFVLDSGREVPIDVLIFATGFEANSFLAPMTVVGTDGTTLESRWRDGAEAFLGISVAGFPNLFLMYGPNTHLGHNSIVFMIECQARYIVDAIRTLHRHELRALDVRDEVQRKFNERLSNRLAGMVWARTPRSWYKNATGRITNNWAGTTTEYWWRTRKIDLAQYRVFHGSR